jgi:hypothetical protein
VSDLYKEAMNELDEIDYWTGVIEKMPDYVREKYTVKQLFTHKVNAIPIEPSAKFYKSDQHIYYPGNLFLYEVVPYGPVYHITFFGELVGYQSGGFTDAPVEPVYSNNIFNKLYWGKK